MFAVGEPNGPEARFAATLETVAEEQFLAAAAQDRGEAPSSTKALAQFDRRAAERAILRTDAKVPPRAARARDPRA